MASPTKAELTAQVEALRKSLGREKAKSARLDGELKARSRDLTEALDQQTATSEILRVISSSPTDIQPVLDAVAESAARLSGSSDAAIFRVDENVLRLAAHHGLISAEVVGQFTTPLGGGTPLGRSVLEGRTVHIADLQTEDDDPVGREFARRHGFRTILIAPLIREGIPIGAITLRRTEARLFSERQVA